MPFVDLLQFSLPIKSNHIHAEGQIAAQADCLLRNANDYIIFVDVDEFIMKFHHENLKTFIQSKINDSIGSFVFPNTFFCNEFDRRNKFPRILNHKIRETYLWPSNVRSKYVIVKPLAAVEQGIHEVRKWKISFGHRLVNVYVNRSEAMLFHYRSCCSIWEDTFALSNFKSVKENYNYNTITDNNMDKFARELFNFFHIYIQD